MIEADFMREYGIDLTFELDSMTWRRFSVLLTGLSYESQYYNIMRHEMKYRPRYIDDIMGF